MKKSEDFDKEIREKLQAWQPDDSGLVSGWERLRESLKRADLADQSFDQTLRNRLAHREEDRSSAGWTGFYAKYKERRARRRQIIGIRIAELSLMILLFWTLDRFHRLHPFREWFQTTATEALVSLPQEKTGENIPESREVQLTASETVLPIKNSKKIKASQSPLTQGIVPIKSAQSPDAAHAINHSAEQTQKYTLPEEQILPDAQNPEPVLPEYRLTGQNTNAPSAETQPSALSGSEVSISKEQTNGSGAEPAVSSIEPATPVVAQESTSIQENTAIPKISEKTAFPAGFRIYLAPSIGGGINLISSPPDLLLGLPKRNQTGSVAQTGIALLFDHGRWILETGLHYSLLSYAPGIEDVYKSQDGSYHKAVFSKAQFHILEIPVMSNLVILHDKRLSWSVGGGLSVAANLHADFEISDGTTDSRPGQGVSHLPRLSYLEEKSYNEGLLHQEDFPANSFANLILGSRLNYQWRDNLQVFSEIRYRKMLSSLGFGPNQDQFRQIGLTAGLMIRIR